MTDADAIQDGSIAGSRGPHPDTVRDGGMGASVTPSSDERPDGWGRCAHCGEDCEEADYDEQRRISLHLHCDDRRNVSYGDVA